MIRYICRRLAALPLILLAVSLLVFMAVRLLPGDPARILAGVQAPQEAVDMVRAQLGLTESWPVQYAHFLRDALLHGDLGLSIHSRDSVTSEIAARLPASAALGGLSCLLAIALGIPAGMLAVAFRGRAADNLLMALSMAAASVAPFWLGLLLMELLAVHLHWLPLLGRGDWRHYLMPVFVLALAPAAMVMRMTRAGLIEVMQAEYIRTARAKGLPVMAVWVRHALRTALLPVITIIGLNIGSLVSGAVITETVFNWGGIGQLLVESVELRDYPVVQAVTLLSVLLVVGSNLVAELVIGLLDPRMREGWSS